MKTKDELFKTWNQERIWQKFCGFFDLSLQEFMEIQENLLLEEIELVADSTLGKKLMSKKKPATVAEFRRLVPLTTYEDYASYFNEKNDRVLAEKPYCWVHTSGRGGLFKWVPYTERGYRRLIDSAMSGFILACATRKGEVNVQGTERVLHNTPPRPYFSGMIGMGLTQLYGFQPIIPLEVSDNMEFQERIAEGFKLSLRTGVDLIASMSSVLVKIGEGFSEGLQGMKFSARMLHPTILYRLTKGILRSKLERRNLLPKDLWPVKGIICGGTDTVIYREQIAHYWGKEPFEYYGATETSITAVQNWNKRWFTFLPLSAFHEFIPETEWLKNRQDKAYQPSTVLLSEVEEGKLYEVVVTNFYGMPFLRYRPGDLIRIVSLRDNEMGINLPQMVFESRADDLIDIAGFTRLDEKTVWQAVDSSGLRYTEWTMRKEYHEGEPVLHLYIELKEEMAPEKVRRAIHNSLKANDPQYRDLERMLEIQPLKAIVLSRGTFQRFYQEKQADGLDLAHLKPPHMNASDTMINDLLRLSRSSQTGSIEI